MQMKFIHVFLCAFLLLLMPVEGRCGRTQDFQKARDAYRSLQNSQKDRLYRHNWEKVIERLSGVQSKYPGSSEGADALFLAGKAWSGLYEVSRIGDDARKAVQAFERLAESYPTHSVADDGLFLAAGLQEKVLGRPGEAWKSYRRIADDFPKADMAPKARDELKRLVDYVPKEKTPAPVAARGNNKAEPPRDAQTSDGPNALGALRFWSNPGYTRVVFDLQDKADYSVNLLPGDPKAGTAPRIYVDIAGVQPASDVASSTDVNDGLLSQIRVGMPAENKTRVVLDLVSLGDYKVFPLEDPFRIVIDVAGDQKPEIRSNEPEIRAAKTESTPEPQPKANAVPASAPDKIAGIVESAPEEKPSKVQIPAAVHNKGLRRIVVDAGHGGKDPGAIGPGGIKEKDVVLDLARKVGARLEKELGCEVVLTRNKDVFIPLEERTAIANKVGADLFISIHANASEDQRAYGTETYYLNFSKNDKAVAVAARENGTSLKQVGDLEMILLDLMANSKINESSHLAAEIQKSLVGHLTPRFPQVRDLGVRQGPFYVLLGATMPSVLVEAAFISHPREEKWLTQDGFQERTAEAIIAGVRNYAIALKLVALK